MMIQWLSWLNYTLLGFALFLGLATGFLWLKQPSAIACVNPQTKECGLPKGAFELSEEVYTQIGEPLLALQQTAPTLQVPDLRQQLIYYGKNGRPDAQSEYTLLHFSLNNKTVVSIAPNEKLYLVYNRKLTPGRYVFSPHNEPTSLWIEAKVIDREIEIQMTLENDKGEKIREPESYAQFRLPEKEFIRYAGSSWEIGSFRVDGTLLARQRARWFGPDYFLERHGGEDYKHVLGKQRIDFGENEDIYSIFVTTGDCLIWDNNKWKVVLPGQESLGYPLLVVKKIDERLLTFELWDVEGKGKILLNVLKSSEPWSVQNAQSLQHMFKFVGARTRTQCVFEINRERVVLKPSDWLLLTAKGWKKLTTEEDIDNYVKRKLSGTLFVFEGIFRKDERQMMKGSLYSPARNDFQSVELALHVGSNKPPTHLQKETKNDKEIHEDFEDDDLDDMAEDFIVPTTREYEMKRNPYSSSPKDQSSKSAR